MIVAIAWKFQTGAMLAGTDRAAFAGKRNAALVLLGFTTAARVSELVSLDLAATEAEHGYDVTMYRKKVRKHTTNVVLYGTDPATCPVRALRTYLAALAAAERTEGPLFLRVDRWDRLAPLMTRNGRPIGDPAGRMTAEAAAEVIERLADAADLTGDWSGHSLRRGFALRRPRRRPRLARDRPRGRMGRWLPRPRPVHGRHRPREE